MRSSSRSVLRFLALLAGVVFCVGCATTRTVFNPDSASPESQTVMMKGVAMHYVHSDKIDIAAGLDLLSPYALQLYLSFKNNSNEPIRVDPAAIECQGVKENGSRQAVAMLAPDKYIANQRAGNVVLVALGGLRNDRSASINALDSALLRVIDVLPGQQTDGIALVSRIYESNGANGSPGKEIAFNRYEVTLTIEGQPYAFAYKREEIKIK